MRLTAESLPHIKAELTANAGGINLDSVVDSIGGALGDSGQRVTDVEEFHTQITHVLGQRPEIVHEETKAVVWPGSSLGAGVGADSSPPEIEIVSNDVKRGSFGGGIEALLGNPLEIFRTSNARVDDGLADFLGGSEANSSSSSTTNVVNIFTFNIYVHNSTERDKKPQIGSPPQPQQTQQQFSYSTSLGHPFMTRLQSTSQVNSPMQKLLSSHHYKANVRNNHDPVKQPPSPSMFPMEMFPSGSDNWLTQLMKRQMNGGADTTALTRAALGRRRRLEDEPDPDDLPKTKVETSPAPDDFPETSRTSNANARPEVNLFQGEGRSGITKSAGDFGSAFFRQFLPDTPVGPQIMAPKKQGSGNDEMKEESDLGDAVNATPAAKPVRTQGFLELADFSFLDHTDDEELSASNAGPPPPFPNPAEGESIYDPSYLIRILADKHVDIEVKEKIVRPLAMTAIPSLFAVAGATSPLWMPFMGGKRRRRKRRDSGDDKQAEISKYWLSYLIGTRYNDDVTQIDDNSAATGTTAMPTTTRRTTRRTTSTTTTTTTSTTTTTTTTTTTSISTVKTTRRVTQRTTRQPVTSKTTTAPSTTSSSRSYSRSETSTRRSNLPTTLASRIIGTNLQVRPDKLGQEKEIGQEPKTATSSGGLNLMSYWNQMYKKQYGGNMGNTKKNRLGGNGPKSNARTRTRNNNSRPLLQNPTGTATTTIINTPRPRQRPQAVQSPKKNVPNKKDKLKRKPPQIQRKSDIQRIAESFTGSAKRATTPVTKRRKWPSSTPRMPPKTTTTTRRPVAKRSTTITTKGTTEKRSPTEREDDAMEEAQFGKIKTWSKVTSSVWTTRTTPAPPTKSTRIITTENASSTPPPISKWVTSGSEFFVLESSSTSTTQKPEAKVPEATSSTPAPISKWVTSGSQFFVRPTSTTPKPELEVSRIDAEGARPLPYHVKLSPGSIKSSSNRWNENEEWAWTTDAPRASAAANSGPWETSGTKLKLGSGDQWIPAPQSTDEEEGEEEWLTAENLFSSTRSAQITTPRPKTVTNSPIVVIPLEGHQSAPQVDVELLRPLVRDPITVINFKQDPSDDDEDNGGSSEEKDEYVGYFVKKLAEGTKRPNRVPSLDVEFSKTTGISTFRPSTESLGWPKLSHFIKGKRPAAPGKTTGKAIAAENSSLFNRKGTAEVKLPDPVVVTSDAIKTKWTPEVASNILKDNSEWFFQSQSAVALDKKPTAEKKVQKGAQKPQGQESSWSEHMAWTTNVPKTTPALSGGFWQSPGAKLGSLWSSVEEEGEEDKMRDDEGEEEFDFGKDKWSFEPLKDTKPEEVFEGSLSLFPEKQSNEEFLDLVRKLEAMSLMRASTTTTKRPRHRTTKRPRRRKQPKPNTSVRPKEKQQQQQQQQQGPLFYPLLYQKHSNKQRETSTSTTATTITETLPDKSEYWRTTTTEAPSPFRAISESIGNSAAPLAGLSAATLVYGAASVLPALFGRRRRRRRRGVVEHTPQFDNNPFMFRPPRIAFSGEQSSYRL